MEFRKATVEYYGEIRDFYDYVIDHTENMQTCARWKKGLHPSDAAIREYLEAGCMYVLTDGAVILGAMAVTMRQGEDYHSIAWETDAKDEDAAVLHILAANPDYRGKGIGKKMVAEAIDLAKEQGKTVFRLDALASNIPARRMYASLGFRLMGKQNLYADNTGWTDFFFYEYPLDEKSLPSSEI